MNKFIPLLSGNDLRSIAGSNKIAGLVRNQNDFDTLFKYVHHPDRLIKMRAFDAIEKISLNHPDFLKIHKGEILSLLSERNEMEVKWHLAQIVSRLMLNKTEMDQVWQFLIFQAADRNESKIVRVNSLQSLYDLSQAQPGKKPQLQKLFADLKEENIPSLNARIRKLQEG